MILDVLHLTACFAMIVAAIILKRQLPSGHSAHKRLLPFALIAGAFGVLSLYRVGMEFFIASYSGAIYEVAPPSHGQVSWIVVSVFVMLLPLTCLAHRVGRRASLAICLGSLAAVPSIFSLVHHP